MLCIFGPMYIQNYASIFLRTFKLISLKLYLLHCFTSVSCHPNTCALSRTKMAYHVRKSRHKNQVSSKNLKIIFKNRTRKGYMYAHTYKQKAQNLNPLFPRFWITNQKISRRNTAWIREKQTAGTLKRGSRH